MEPHLREGDGSPGDSPVLLEGDCFRLHSQRAVFLHLPSITQHRDIFQCAYYLTMPFLFSNLFSPEFLSALKDVLKDFFLLLSSHYGLRASQSGFSEMESTFFSNPLTSSPNLNGSPSSFLHNRSTCPVRIPCHHTSGLVLHFLDQLSFLFRFLFCLTGLHPSLFF